MGGYGEPLRTSRLFLPPPPDYGGTLAFTGGDIRMSSSGGIIRFLLFVAVVALGATGYYAYSQTGKLEAYRKANALLQSERDALTVKNAELTTAMKNSEVKAQEMQAQLTQAQEQLEAAKKPRARR